MRKDWRKQVATRVIMGQMSELRYIDILPYMPNRHNIEDREEVMSLIDAAEIKVTWPRGK